MLWLKNILCGVAAVFVAEFVPAVYWFVRDANSQKATGFAVLPFAFIESLLSPLFWVLAISFFFFFRWASRNGNAVVRVILFWVPGVTSSIFSAGFLATVGYLYWHYRHA